MLGLSQNQERSLARAENESLKRARRMMHAFMTQAPSAWDEETRRYSEESVSHLSPSESRALSAITGTGGAFLIPQDFMPEYDVALKSWSGMVDGCRTVETLNGQPLPWPKMDDSANSGELLAENVATVDNADPTYSQLTLKAWTYSSKMVRCPYPLLLDGGPNLEKYLFDAFGQRIGRSFNAHATLGTGSSQPRGLITALLADTTPVAAAASSAIAYDDLVNLEGAIDPSYRNLPGMGWMMHYDVLKAIRKLKDASAQPIFKAADGVRPSTILGWPFFINQDMDNTIATGKETVVFGLLEKYVIRRGGQPVMFRLFQRYAELFQMGFLLVDRLDGQLVMGGNKAIQVLQHP